MELIQIKLVFIDVFLLVNTHNYIYVNAKATS